MKSLDDLTSYFFTEYNDFIDVLLNKFQQVIL